MSGSEPRSFTIRTTIADRLHCETISEIGAAVLELFDHRVSQGWNENGNKVVFEMLLEKDQ